MRNRIIGHVQCKASDLVHHELNPRVHSPEQKDALAAIYREVGFARSVLAYQLPDGRLKLIDGHLRTSQHKPDDMIDVEVLDVTDAEARKLLLTIDPLATLANYSDGALLALRDFTKSDEAVLEALWSSLHQEEIEQPSTENKEVKVTSQWLVIIDCTGESQQAITLATCQREGLVAKAVSS